MLKRISIWLVAHYSDGRSVPHEDFLGCLVLGTKTAYPSEGQWQSARVALGNSEFGQFEGPVDAPDHFGAHVKAELSGIAQWVAAQDRSAFATFVARGLRVELIVDVFIDQDQMDLVIPPVLLTACGERDVPIYLLSND